MHSLQLQRMAIYFITNKFNKEGIVFSSPLIIMEIQLLQSEVVDLHLISGIPSLKLLLNKFVKVKWFPFFK